MYKSSPRNLPREQLRELANGQGGYFTTRQAEGVGFARNNHPHHVASGAWERVWYGIFRLSGVPVPDPMLAELHMWLLWTIGRKDPEPRGAIAYETALIVYGLSDLMIHRVHLWVPKAFRVSAVPAEIVLHRGERDTADLTKRDGLRIVRPLSTIIDLLREGRVSLEHIERGFRDGMAKGEITHADLASTTVTPAELRQLHAWLKDPAG